MAAAAVEAEAEVGLAAEEAAGEEADPTAGRRRRRRSTKKPTICLHVCDMVRILEDDASARMLLPVL